jgi:hypothetical protein
MALGHHISPVQWCCMQPVITNKCIPQADELLHEKVWEVIALAFVSALVQVPPQWKTPEAMQMKWQCLGGKEWEEATKRNEVTPMKVQLPSVWKLEKALTTALSG